MANIADLLWWPKPFKYDEFHLYLPVSIASVSFVFHCSATSFAKGSSGFGALSKAWIDSNTVLI